MTQKKKPATVFVTNWGQEHDYSPAASFGSLRPVTTGNFPIFKTTRLRDEIIAALLESAPDDYLALSGSSVIASLCVTIWLELHGRCNMLLHVRDRRSSKDAYELRTVTKEDIRVAIEQLRDERQRRLVRGRPEGAA